MNTLQNLIDNGIEIHTAESMLENYKLKIGTMNGMYLISDIEYDFNIRGRIVTLECSECGNVIHRTMIKGRNKWSELIKFCDCQKKKKHELKNDNLKKIKNQKRALILSRVGQVFEDFEIIFVDDIDENPKYTMKCNECGYERMVSANRFDQMKDFKCHKHYNPIKYDESYIGRKINFLEIKGIEYRCRDRMFRCHCECGNEKLIRTYDVVNGIIKSCGCKHDELLSTHGLSNTRLYRIWNGMNQRCYNEKATAYENYGGRGIQICDEWENTENGLQIFIEWALNNGYSDELSIDRINVNGNYEPSNCRWTDWETQANNRRPKSEWKKRKGLFEIDGKSMLLKDICRLYDTSEPSIRYRMIVMNMTFEEAVKTPKRTNGRPRKVGS